MCTSYRELLQKGSWLTAPKGNTHPAGGILPSIMNILRTPATLSISSNPNGNYGAPVGASAANCALFPFQTKQHEYEVLCSLSKLCCHRALYVGFSNLCLLCVVTGD